MHTATRLAGELIPKIRALNPAAHLCAYGLYAPLNEEYLRGLGVETVLGGRVRAGPGERGGAAGGGSIGAVGAAHRARSPAVHRTGPQHAAGAFPLCEAARQRPSKVAGYTEASRGCKHLCRHCPVVPVYQGAFRHRAAGGGARRRPAAGGRRARSTSPSAIPISSTAPRTRGESWRSLHREFPALTYDVTIKVEHLRTHRELIATLKDTGCLFVTTRGRVSGR